jgi:pyruvate,water dikinase
MAYDLRAYEFNEEEDIEKYGCFILGTVWYPPPWVPLFEDLWRSYGQYGMQYGAEMICEPTGKGWVWRNKVGANYLTVNRTTEEERKAREPIWRERMTKVVDDPWFWLKLRDELKAVLERFAAVDPEKMSDIDLASHFMDVWHSTKQQAEFHFRPMYALGQGHNLFRTMCPEITGIKVTDPKYATLMSGFDNEILRSNKELAELASRALEMKLGNNLKLPDEQVIPAMEQSDAGRKWLEGFWGYLKRRGLRKRRGLEIATPTWQEKPTLAIDELKRMAAIGGVDAPGMKREELVKQREEAEREVLAMVPQDQREWFEKLMRCTQGSHVFSEEHQYWCEDFQFSLVRRASIALGKKFVAAGIIDHHEDVLYLQHCEILDGSITRQKSNLRRVVKKRMKEYDGYLKVTDKTPMFLGDPSILPKMIASDATFCVTAVPQVAKPEEVGATLVGGAGAPGVVEGIARVIMTDAQWDEVQPGEILVSPYTSPTWTPLFGIIKAAVTDGGGYLAHAALVGREYGIPAVVGTMEATKKIKTGQRIRVDGNLLRVYVLE